ncbi:MAG: hypothetical protein QXM68_00065 [Candidatus Aenigmatarchaeota archaeon]|nr:hypothetical protein [Candidatus Aenigmarchaeota archaeon]
MLRQWKNYWGMYSSDNPISRFMNVWVLVTALILLIIGLVGVSVKTGNYAKVLENNVTVLSSNLQNCLNDKQQFNSDLETCNLNLQNKVSSLNSCQTDRTNLDSKLTICTRDLAKCEDQYSDLESKYSSTADKYDKCKDELNKVTNDRNNIQSNFDQLKSNYITNYVRDFCCLRFRNTTTSKTYYTFSNNIVACFNNSVSGSTEFSC